MRRFIGGIVCSLGISIVAPLMAAPNGVIMYQGGQRAGYAKVPSDADTGFFGKYLRGPIIENKFTSYRCFIVALKSRVAFDINGKTIEGSTLNNFTSIFNTHAELNWCSDVFEVGATVGLGGFRLLDGSNFLYPDFASNLDSLTVRIVDSSTASPKLTIGYYGWTVKTGKKMTALLTINAHYDLRTVDCELKMSGDTVGKIVAGMAQRTPVTRDKSKGLLYCLGITNAATQAFVNDSQLTAIHAEPAYMDTFIDGIGSNFITLKPDNNRTVKWSFLMSWVREPNPLFRNSNWIAATFGTTSIHAPVSRAVKVKAAGSQIIIPASYSRRINVSGSAKYFDIRGCRVESIANKGVLIIRK